MCQVGHSLEGCPGLVESDESLTQIGPIFQVASSRHVCKNRSIRSIVQSSPIFSTKIEWTVIAGGFESPLTFGTYK